MSDSAILDPSVMVPAVDPVIDSQASVAPTALSDLLVEDVSIDGMCGVY